ncbi:tRNA-specific adenosine deaminase 1-like [Trichoplusia ni]|uniref:tRNA-specific adenosine deaminase 1 n=1 Tax=Trichoplusia ni TaxID=7111 RepID=A0A7E5W9B3_TRINI|nr:tRNA-specific adenosine deaminase 1-like [Trichoplusia ni]
MSNMSNLSETLIDKIVESCFEVYYDLPKNGKPVEKEWTVLSCIIMYNKYMKTLEVASLGTGSKCIGATKMSPTGVILNDSHAEVFARRGFLLYLYHNIDRALKHEPSIFRNCDGHLKLYDGIEFIFYSSQLPCGDASIIRGGEEDYGDVLKPEKRKADDETCDIDVKKQKTDNGVHRTGAKCLPHCEQDPKDPEIVDQLLGQVRTKPGKGDKTLSVSCSDKIAKWIHLGIQGSLIDMLCEPIYIKYFIFGNGVPYSEQSLKRAFLNRAECSSLKLDIVPEFYQTSLVFPHVCSDENVRPAPGSIIWSRTNTHQFEVAVQGKKLGATKKNALLPRSSLCISKYKLYKKFLQILNKNEVLKKKICGEENIECIPYNKMKRKSTRYIAKWSKIKEKFFKTWTIKPDMWGFCVNMT